MPEPVGGPDPWRFARRIPAQLRRLATGWRRSLQLRVVLITVSLGVLVVAVLGSFLLTAIRDGLVDARQASAEADAAAATAEVQSRFDAADQTDPEALSRLVNDVARFVERTDPEARRGVVLLQVLGSERERVVPDFTLSEGLTSAPVESVIPQDLREAVAAGDGQFSRFVDLPTSTGTSAGLAVGELVTVSPLAGDYELYFVFPLDREQETLDLLERLFLVGGVVLVLLVGAIAWVVTRQVAAPLRMAAITSERLAAGQLDQRMTVKGEDELARLAASFNEMGSSLQSQIGQLEELSRVQRRFVADVSHELRTPLTTLQMAGEVIHDARAGFEPSVARSAELLLTQLDRFESLLADLLEISRFDAGAAALEVEDLDLRDLVSRVVENAVPLAERRGSVFTVRLSRGPAPAEVDRRRVERVLRNLVANAVEHGAGRPIEVTLAAGPGAVAVTVRDHGVGLRPGEAALVFDRFWRADPARARTTGGTGLGLAISLEDARLHNGWLQAWGDPGDGACFRLTLPRRAGTEPAHSPLPLEPPDRRGARQVVGGPYQTLTAAGRTDVAGSGSGELASAGPARASSPAALPADDGVPADTGVPADIGASADTGVPADTGASVEDGVTAVDGVTEGRGRP